MVKKFFKENWLKIIVLIICVGIGYFLSFLSKGGATDLVNTYRDTRLLLQINYPKDWMVSDYTNSTKEENCHFAKQYCTGTTFVIASLPSPAEGWDLMNPPPVNYKSVYVEVNPTGTNMGYKDMIEEDIGSLNRNNNNYVREKKEIEITDENKLTILVVDYRDESKNGGEGFPTAIAYYYGNYYNYEFMIPGWGPRSEDEINIFKQIVSSFKEIK